MVPTRSQQYNVLLEAVQNHTPDVLIVDEIGDTKVSVKRRLPLSFAALNK